MADFKEIPSAVVDKLVDFAYRKNIGKSISIDGKTYTLNFISESSSAFFHSRCVSIYYKTGSSIVRLSDHWSSSNGFAKSRKMNCGPIGKGKKEVDKFGEVSYGGAPYWNLKNKTQDYTPCNRFGFGKYGTKIFGGICGLSVLNKECDHWK